MCWYWSPVCLVWRPLSFCPFLVSLSRRNLSLPSLPVELNVHFSFLYYPLLPPSSFFLICASPPHLTGLVPVPILRCTFDKCALYFQTLALVGNTCRGNWSKHSFKIRSLWRRTSIQVLWFSGSRCEGVNRFVVQGRYIGFWLFFKKPHPPQRAVGHPGGALSSSTHADILFIV